MNDCAYLVIGVDSWHQFSATIAAPNCADFNFLRARGRGAKEVVKLQVLFHKIHAFFFYRVHTGPGVGDSRNCSRVLLSGRTRLRCREFFSSSYEG